METSNSKESDSQSQDDSASSNRSENFLQNLLGNLPTPTQPSGRRESSALKPIHLQDKDERRTSMFFLAADIRDCFEADETRRINFESDEILEEVDESPTAAVEKTSQRRKSSFQGTTERIKEQGKTEKGSPKNILDQLRKLTPKKDSESSEASDSDDESSSSEEQQEIKEPQVLLDTSENTLSHLKERPRMSSRRSTAWLGPESDEVLKTAERRESTQTKLQTYIRRPSWYDDENIEATGAKTFILPLEQIKEEEELEREETTTTKKSVEESSAVTVSIQGWELKDSFRNRFRRYASIPDRMRPEDPGPDAPLTISREASDRWLENAKILDHQKLTVVHTGLFFEAVCGEEKDRLNLEEFLEFLEDLTGLSQLSFKQITERLSTCEDLDSTSSEDSREEKPKRKSLIARLKNFFRRRS